MTTRWQKFRLLMWKNYLLQWRHPYQTVLELVAPSLFAALLVFLRFLVKVENIDTDLKFPPLPLKTLNDIFNNNSTSLSSNFSREIFYSPQSRALEQFFEHVQNRTFPLFKISSALNSSELESQLIRTNSFAGVEFPDDYSALTHLPDSISYSLRFPSELRQTNRSFDPSNFNWRTNLLFPRFQAGGARNWKYDHDGVAAGYYIEGFMFLQQFIFKAFAKIQNENVSIPEINVAKLPHPPFISDALQKTLYMIISVIILLIYVYPCINIIKYITTEKQKQLKEAMKIMGLDSWLHWTAWFVKCFIYMAINVTLIVILLKTRWFGEDNPNSVFTYSSATALWFFLLTYSITTIMFCFMLSVFFSKADTASSVAGLIWFLFYIPYTFVHLNYDNITLTSKVALCFFSNTAMSLGFNIVIQLEGTQEGLQWQNIFQPVNVDDGLHLGLVLIMLAVDAVLYLLIALYVENIFPGDYGVAERWNFPLTVKFWRKVFNLPAIDYKTYEMHPIAPGVHLQNLRKVYSNQQIAVERLNFQMKEGEITVLLGHNGAGKTTTMSMLTGMISPTSGTAVINGFDIRRNIQAVRSSIGLCPQHNILFDALTVKEHIIFYSQLKGLSLSKANEEVKKYVVPLGLESKIDSQAGTLSGGMKRKLAVGIALCANSRFVLLDEPSSGVDPSSRRALWDVLEKEKQERTILLSTHFMDEADVLGDKIAIMSAGKLKAIGSSFSLKSKYGVGYHLVCVKKTSCNVSKVTSLLSNHIPDIQLETDIGTELSYLLDRKHVSKFQKMLEDLETNSDELESFGISLTTLEEVFLKVGSDNINYNTNNENISSRADCDTGKLLEDAESGFYKYSEQMELLSGIKLYMNQFKALMEKKALNAARNRFLLLVQVLIPVLFIALIINIIQSFGGTKDLSKLNLDLATYRNTKILADYGNFTTNDTFETEIYHQYRALVNVEDVGSDDMSTYYLKLSKKYLARVNKVYLYGASFRPSNITVWYNNKPYHSPPISLSLVHNAILKSITKKKCSIHVANHPLPFKSDSRLAMQKTLSNLGFQLSFNIGFAMAIVASFFVIPYIKERSTKAKLLQFVSGINVGLYWLTAFIWDFLVFIVIAAFVTATIGVFQEDGYSTSKQLGVVFFILVMFGFSILPFIYIAALFFNGAASGFTKLIIIFMFPGAAMFTVEYFLRFKEFNLEDFADDLRNIFLAFPHYSLSNAINNMNMLYVTQDSCEKKCQKMNLCDEEECQNLGSFEWNDTGVIRNLIFFIAFGITAFCVLFLIELKVFEDLNQRLKMIPRVLYGLFFKRQFIDYTDDDKQECDLDVWTEKESVNYMLPKDFKRLNLVMKNVSLKYGDFKAVNQLCVGIKHSECFGLLGVNGAGKTSTFRMLTGDIKISHGEAWVQGMSLKTNMKDVHKRIGYCPQFDALLEDLTGRETLKFFAMCRGVPNYRIKEVTEKLSTDFNFVKHLDKQVKAYSGGNKRKLSTAVALLGNPSIVYLDEPTTGMDPGAKRNLWDVICQVRDSGKTIVLTSHSMEECEALCTRLAIMVNGEFKCLGSTQHLKNKFGEGFWLTLKIKRNNSSDSLNMLEEKMKVNKFLVEKFQVAILKEEHADMLTYNIPSKNIKWSSVFGILEEAKTRLNIDDYSIGQSSLEQIFLSFTKHQRATTFE